MSAPDPFAGGPSKPRISQQSFLEAVDENIDAFDMEPEEAVEDARQAFEAQGVDLRGDCLRLAGRGGRPPGGRGGARMPRAGGDGRGRGPRRGCRSWGGVRGRQRTGAGAVYERAAGGVQHRLGPRGGRGARGYGPAQSPPYHPRGQCHCRARLAGVHRGVVQGQDRLPAGRAGGGLGQVSSSSPPTSTPGTLTSRRRRCGRWLGA